MSKHSQTIHRAALFAFCLLNAGPAWALNSPNVSANALFLGRQSNWAKEDTDTTRNGFDLQEAELAFYADVDPYSRLNVLLTVAPSYAADPAAPATATGVKQSWTVEPEELFAETSSIPWTTLRLGKFKAAMGKHNQLHSHAYPFVEAPVVNTTAMGGEGLNDVGLSAAVLLPSPWFSELTAQYLRGEGENDEFNSPTPGDGVGVAHWKNLFDLNDDSTFEIGVSYASGANSLHGTTSLSGADLTYKWRPSEGGKTHSLVVALEALQRRLEDPSAADAEKISGGVLWAQYQFAERWAALARAESMKVENSTTLANDSTTKSSFGVVFNATEFSSYKLEYDMLHGPPHSADPGDTDERKILFQANFTIGAHPAHSY